MRISTGTRLFGLTPAAQDGEAVEARQTEIEHDRVVGLGGAHELALLAVGGPVDGIALAGEAGDELACQVGIVLDDEHAHGPSAQSSFSVTGSPVAAS